MGDTLEWALWHKSTAVSVKKACLATQHSRPAGDGNLAGTDATVNKKVPHPSHAFLMFDMHARKPQYEEYAEI